jgi:formylglycine-generating enzyme
MKARSARRSAHALSAVIILAGCSKVLGFEDPVAVECVTSNDCGEGFACLDGACQCVDGCGEGGLAGSAGSAGTAGAQAGSAGSTTGPAGGTSPGGAAAGEGGEESGGKGGRATGASGEGGHAATSGGDGGDGGAGNGAGGVDGGQSGVGGTPSAGQAGDGGAGGEPPVDKCDPDTTCLDCDELGNVRTGSPCPAACRSGQQGRTCFSPPSCSDFSSECIEDSSHPDFGASCCLSLPMEAGAYDRSCVDNCRFCPGAGAGFTGSVSSFSLDAFEVTVRRFRRFVMANASNPAPGSGRNPKNPDDAGWDESWNQFLPDTSEELRAMLTSTEECALETTWSEDVGSNEYLPINCVNWYVAQAFCIWDGGRLPTLLEWEFAAGGAEERVYPWSSPANDATLNSKLAVYSPSTRPEAVGSKPAGQGKWGHYDLAGNVREWTWDGDEPCYSENPCIDCGRTAESAKVQRGGSFKDIPEFLRVATRVGTSGLTISSVIGFRCARDFE